MGSLSTTSTCTSLLLCFVEGVGTSSGVSLMGSLAITSEAILGDFAMILSGVEVCLLNSVTCRLSLLFVVCSLLVLGLLLWFVFFGIRVVPLEDFEHVTGCHI